MTSSVQETMNERSYQPEALKDPEFGVSAEVKTDSNNELGVNEKLEKLMKMMEVDFNKVENHLVNLAATHLNRPDMAFGKQADIAIIDNVREVQAAPVAPVSKTAASGYANDLRHVNTALAVHDAKLQQIFDLLALSRAGRKPDMFNPAVEYDRLLSFFRQTEMHWINLTRILPESLPDNTEVPITELIPEFTDKLLRYDSEFGLLHEAIEKELKQAELAVKKLN
ncbi:hypothetical protein [uncultured Endozoicomonas sp.]|uniref:hypothetical protein n=1 Tax=uncultured Endozoicomonas sp. TaxID=432652 RepID=UPI002627FA4F|nr:hypothetical protein [uncultured Endozoicomonas sp.]